MFDKEKRKGVPTRGLLYLAVGIAIGVVGMMIVTMIANRSVRPDFEPTTLPVIPTPAMGVTGTADAQTVVRPHRLLAFAVDETNDQIALSYMTGRETFLALKPWQDTHVGTTPPIILVRGGAAPAYMHFSFNPMAEPPTLMVSPSDNSHMRIFDTTLEQNVSRGGMNNVTDSLYSPNGAWLAVIQDNQSVKISRTPPGTFDIVPVQGRATSITFSADSQMLAVASIDAENANKLSVDVFRLPTVTPTEAHITLTPVRSYSLEGGIASPIVFSPDNIHMAVVVDNSIRVLSLTDDEQRYFDVGTPVRHLTIDPSGRWLAVSGITPGTEETRFITIYSLEEGNALAPELVMTQSISMNANIAGLQFVDEGLLVGEDAGTLTLYRWTGELWGDPITAMAGLE